jgi:hypothetical protein
MYGKFMYMRLLVLENAIFDCYHDGYARLLFRSLHQSPLMITHCQTYHEISAWVSQALYSLKNFHPKCAYTFRFSHDRYMQCPFHFSYFGYPFISRSVKNRILYWFSLFLLLDS